MYLTSREVQNVIQLDRKLNSLFFLSVWSQNTIWPQKFLVLFCNWFRFSFGSSTKLHWHGFNDTVESFFNLFELLVTHKFEFFILLFPNREYSAQTCFLKSQMNFEINQFIPCHILKIYQDGTCVKTIVYAISVPLLWKFWQPTRVY